MKDKFYLTMAALCATATMAIAAESAEAPLEERSSAPRWRISAGARFAPGVKATSRISSQAVTDAAGRLRGAAAQRSGSIPAGAQSSTTERTAASSTDESSETLPVTPTSRFEFDNGFIDMADDAGIPGETSNWHFDSADVFDEASGTITVSSAPSATTSRESATTRRKGETADAAATRTALAEQLHSDVTSSHDFDAWGGDFEIGYDFFVGGQFTLGMGLGATFYRNEDAIRAAGRCYSATAVTKREKTSGHYEETTSMTRETTETTKETTTFADANLAYSGALADVSNDDGSIGAGTADGYTNPYGGNNPVLTFGDGSIARTTERSSSTETTVTRTGGFVKDGTSMSATRRSRTIDVLAEGDVKTQEIRLALQPTWRATDWLELRGSFGAAATRVTVDADATMLVDGARCGMLSGDDDGWIVTGLCGLDAVVSPIDRLSFFVGVDLRIGNNKFDYEAGFVKGEVELARATYRAGIAIRF